MTAEEALVVLTKLGELERTELDAGYQIDKYDAADWMRCDGITEADIKRLLRVWQHRRKPVAA